MNALLIIDVQNYFINEISKGLPGKIAGFIEKNKFDFILFSQFFNTLNSFYYRLHHWDKMFASPDTDIIPELGKYVGKENVFKKYKFSVFTAQGFPEYLKLHYINQLFICGMDTDACIYMSEMEAVEKGYDAKVIKDLSLSQRGNKYHLKGIELLIKNLGKQSVITSDNYRYP